MTQKRGTRAEPTLKQQKAIDGFLAVLGGTSRKTITQILRDAGYTDNSATGWGNVMKGLRPHLQPHLDWLELHRAQIMGRMEKEVRRAGYADLVRGLKTVNEAMQLLGGKPTQRLALTSDDRQQIEQMLTPHDDETDEGED
jgi:hypothetical protein